MPDPILYIAAIVGKLCLGTRLDIQSDSYLITEDIHPSLGVKGIQLGKRRSDFREFVLG